MEKQRIFASFINVFCLLHYKAFVLQDFLKRFFQSYLQHVHYASVALCAFGTSVILSFMLSPLCSPLRCVPFKCSRLTLSLHISEEPYLGLQQFGVISFEIRTLMYCHTEQRRTRRFYIAEIVRHRGTVGAWSSREYLRVLLMFLSTSLQSICFARFLKTFFSKLSATRTLRLCCSLCLWHLRNIVFYAFTSVLSFALCDNTSKF